MNIKVINVLPHEPDYRFMSDQPRPPVSWDTPNGEWVGIYNNEIPNKLGNQVLRHTNEFSYEVWQPDYRADKMYHHQFENGMVHRLFPAERIPEWFGIKRRWQLHSPALVQYLATYRRQNQVVVNLNGDICVLNAAIMADGQDLPILQTFRGTLRLPKTLILKPRLNVLAAFTYLVKHRQAQRLIKSVDFVTYQNSLYQKELRQLFDGPTDKLTSGCDFSFWHTQDQTACRKALEIPLEKPVFLVSSLLKPLKQIDQVIRVFKELEASHDFLLIISGHGEDQYERYLQDLAQPLIKKGKARFVGYISGEQARRYYNSADLFINSSTTEGGPVSAMKALACETPVFSTDIGNVAERMRDNGAGILVGISDYAQWKQKLAHFMDGAPVKEFDRTEAEAHYDWQKIAAKFSEIYGRLGRQYYP